MDGRLNEWLGVNMCSTDRFHLTIDPFLRPAYVYTLECTHLHKHTSLDVSSLIYEANVNVTHLHLAAYSDQLTCNTTTLESTSQQNKVYSSSKCAKKKKRRGSKKKKKKKPLGLHSSRSSMRPREPLSLYHPQQFEYTQPAKRASSTLNG